MVSFELVVIISVPFLLLYTYGCGKYAKNYVHFHRWEFGKYGCRGGVVETVSGKEKKNETFRIWGFHVVFKSF